MAIYGCFRVDFGIEDNKLVSLIGFYHQRAQQVLRKEPIRRATEPEQLANREIGVPIKWTAIKNRYDFVYLFDVANGNPNGDPDAGNLPRLDPETNQGLVSDVSLKRKVRNYVALAKGDEAGHEIFVAERAILELQQKRAWDAVIPEATDKERERLPKDERKARELTRWMCANFFDIRAFGAVMSTKGANCGQVRGPVQFSFARSIEPILPLEISITRMAATTAKPMPSDRAISARWAASISCPTASFALMAMFPPVWPATAARAPGSPRTTSSCFGKRWNACSTTTGRQLVAKWRRGA